MPYNKECTVEFGAVTIHVLQEKSSMEGAPIRLDMPMIERELHVISFQDPVENLPVMI